MDKDWTIEAVDAGASAPGALTLGGQAGTIINVGSAFLAASSGFSIVAGAGIKPSTIGRSTGPTGNMFAGTGACWVLPFTAFLSATVWPNTQPGPEALYSEICLMAVLDHSPISHDLEGISVGITNNAATFGFGVAGGINRVSGVIKPNQASHGATFATAQSTFAQLGAPSQPDCVAVCCTAQGGATFWGISPGGIAYPSTWYGRDQHNAAMLLNNPLTAGGYIRNAGGIFLSVEDQNKLATVPLGTLKRWSLWARNPLYRLPPLTPASLVPLAA